MVKRLVLSVLLLAGVIVVAFGLLWSGALEPGPHGAVENGPPAGGSARTAGSPPLAGTVANFTVFDPPRPAPEAVFSGGDGNEVGLADFRGEVVLLNFWATWCIPCLAEMPALDRLQAAQGQEGLVVIALSQDRAGAPAVVRFYEEYDFGNLGVYVDPEGKVAGAFEIGVLPTTLLIDRDGNVVGQLVGAAEWDSAEAQALIRHYLEAGGPPRTTTAGG